MPTTTSTPAGNPSSRPSAHPAHIPGAAPQPPRGKGGSFSTMLGGMTLVAAGFLTWYFAQFRIQGKRNPAEAQSLAEIPSWQLRHAQQVPGLVRSPPAGERMLAPQTPDFEPKPAPSLPLPGKKTGGGGVVAEALTRSTGKGSDATQKHPDHVDQPAPVDRKNDSGNTYTKKSDDKDGYKKQ